MLIPGTQSGLKPKSVRVFSGLLAFVFLFETVLWSAPAPAAVVFPRQEVARLVQNLEIPDAIGSVKSRYLPPQFFSAERPSPVVVIHIQDAHAHPEAQRNISAILEHLSRGEEKIRKVALEGAKGRLEPALLVQFESSEVNASMARYLADLGELTGAEIFSLGESAKQVDLVGVEEPEFYHESFQLFQGLKKRKAEIQAWLQAYQYNLDRLEDEFFSEDLRGFVRARRSWEARDHDPLEAFRTLRELAKKHLDLDLADPRNQFEWPNLSRLMKVEDVQGSFDLQKARRSARGLARKLAKLKSAEAAPEGKFLAEGLKLIISKKGPEEFRAWIAEHEGFQKIKSARIFFEHLWKRTLSEGISLFGHPDFLGFAGQIILREEIDTASLFKELEVLEKDLETKLAGGGSEKALLKLGRDYLLITKLLSINMTREDDALYQKIRKRLRPGAFRKRFKTFGGERKNASYPRLAPDLFGMAEKFYLLSKKRDETLLENTLKLAGETSGRVKTAVLIAGGFHTDGLVDRLKEKNIAHIVIAPRMTEFENPDLYEEVMMGTHANLELLKSAGSALAKWYLTQLVQSSDYASLSGVRAEEPRNLILRAWHENAIPELRRLGVGEAQIAKDLGTAAAKLGIFGKSTRVEFDAQTRAIHLFMPEAEGRQTKVLLSGARIETEVIEAPAGQTAPVAAETPGKWITWQDRAAALGQSLRQSWEGFWTRAAAHPAGAALAAWIASFSAPAPQPALARRSEVRTLPEELKTFLDPLAPATDPGRQRLEAALGKLEEVKAAQAGRLLEKSREMPLGLGPSRVISVIEDMAREIYDEYNIRNLPLGLRVAFALSAFDPENFSAVHQRILGIVGEIDLKAHALNDRIDASEYAKINKAFSDAEYKETIDQNMLLRFALNRLIFDMPRRERRSLEREYLAQEFMKDFESPGSGKVPQVIFITDLHGAVNVGPLIGFGLGLSDAPEEYQNIQSPEELQKRLEAKGVSLDDKSFTGGSDYVDRGPKPVWGFRFNEWLRARGMLKFIDGNHDDWKDENILGVHLRVHDTLRGIAASGKYAESDLESHLEKIRPFVTTVNLDTAQKAEVENQLAGSIRQFLKAAQEGRADEGVIDSYADIVIDSGTNPNHSLEWWAREWGDHAGWADTFLDQLNEELINGFLAKIQAHLQARPEMLAQLAGVLASDEAVPQALRPQLEAARAGLLGNLQRYGTPFEKIDAAVFSKSQAVKDAKTRIEQLKKENEAIRNENAQKAAAGRFEEIAPQKKVPTTFPETAQAARKILDEITALAGLLNQALPGLALPLEPIEFVTPENYRRNPTVVRTVLWDLKNTRSVYVDPYANITTHGIIPVEKDANDFKVEYKGLKGVAAIERIQYDIRRFFEKFDTIPDTPEFREQMMAEIGEALRVKNDWYSDLLAYLKPVEIKMWLERGGPSDFPYSYSSSYSAREFAGNKGVHKVGHVESKKLREIGLPYWVGGLEGGLVNGDDEMSSGYAGLGGIITFGLMVKGERTGMRRYGYTETAISVEKNLKDKEKKLKDEQAKLGKAQTDQKPPEEIEALEASVKKLQGDVDKLKAQLERVKAGGDLIQDTTFVGLPASEKAKAEAFWSGKGFTGYYAARFLEENAEDYRLLKEEALARDRKDRAAYYERKEQEARKAFEAFSPQYEAFKAESPSSPAPAKRSEVRVERDQIISDYQAWSYGYYESHREREEFKNRMNTAEAARVLLEEIPNTSAWPVLGLFGDIGRLEVVDFILTRMGEDPAQVWIQEPNDRRDAVRLIAGILERNSGAVTLEAKERWIQRIRELFEGVLAEPVHGNEAAAYMIRAVEILDPAAAQGLKNRLTAELQPLTNSVYYQVRKQVAEVAKIIPGLGLQVDFTDSAMIPDLLTHMREPRETNESLIALNEIFKTRKAEIPADIKNQTARELFVFAQKDVPGREPLSEYSRGLAVDVIATIATPEALEMLLHFSTARELTRVRDAAMRGFQENKEAAVAMLLGKLRASDISDRSFYAGLLQAITPFTQEHLSVLLADPVVQVLRERLSVFFGNNLPVLSEFIASPAYPRDFAPQGIAAALKALEKLEAFRARHPARYPAMVYQWGFETVAGWAQLEEELPVGIFELASEFPRGWQPSEFNFQDPNRRKNFSAFAERVMAQNSPEFMRAFMTLIMSSPDLPRQIFGILEVIEKDPRKAVDLIALVTVILELKGAALGDGVQEIVSRLLNSGMDFDSFLAQRLLRSMPFPKSAVSGNPREGAVHLEDSSRPGGTGTSLNLAHYIRMKIHRDKDSSDRELLAGFVEAMRRNDLAPVRGQIKPKYAEEVLADITPEMLGRWHEIVKALFQAYNTELQSRQEPQVSDIAMIPLPWIETFFAGLQVGSAEDRKFVESTVRLHRALIGYYGVNPFAAENFASPEVKQLIEERKYLPALRAVNREIAKLKEKSFARVEELAIDEERYYKRHIAEEAWGFYSFGSDMKYSEPKFNSFNVLLNLNVYQNLLLRKLFEEEISGFIKNLPTSQSQRGDIESIAAYLSELTDYLIISGLGSSELKAVNEVLRNRRMNLAELQDVLVMFSEEYKRILDYFNNTYGGLARRAAALIGRENLLPKYRDRFQEGMSNDEYHQLVEETLIGDLVAAEEALSVFERLVEDFREVLRPLEARVAAAIRIGKPKEPLREPVRLGKGRPASAVSAGMDEIGKKGLNLTALGDLTPPGTIFPVSFSNIAGSQAFEKTLVTEILSLENAMGRYFPFGPDILARYPEIEENRRQNPATSPIPLLFSTRSGSIVSMPGQLGTVINAPMNEAVVTAMIQAGVDPHSAWDLYRNFLSSYAQVVYNIEDKEFADIVNQYKKQIGKEDMRQLSAEEIKEIARRFAERIMRTGPDFNPAADPLDLLHRAIAGVYRSWQSPQAVQYREQIRSSGQMNFSDTWGTAVTLQAMVFGNLTPDSSTAVIFSREADTGIRRVNGAHKQQGQGPDLVGGLTTHAMPVSKFESRPGEPSLEETNSELYRQYADIAYDLDLRHRAPQDIEVTVQEGVFWVLQNRNAERGTSHKPLVVGAGLSPSASGAGVSGSAAGGYLIFADKLTLPELKAKIAAMQREGQRREVILVLGYMTPEDALKLTLPEVSGAITPVVGQSAHATLIGRKFGKSLVSGVGTLRSDGKGGWTLNDKPVKEGTPVFIDGSPPSASPTSGRVYLNPKAGAVGVGEREISGLERELEARRKPLLTKAGEVVKVPEPEKPLEAVPPAIPFEYDAAQKPLLTSEPARVAVNLGYYAYDADAAGYSSILASNFDKKGGKQALNTVSNRTFDAYLRDILGDPNTALTDIYGIRDFKSFYANLIGNVFHGRYPAEKIVHKAVGAVHLLIINGHEIRIHRAPPDPGLLRGAKTDYLIDFSDIDLTNESHGQRQARLKNLQAESGLRKVFVFSDDEDPPGQIFAAGLNAEKLLTEGEQYVQLASPLTSALAQALSVVNEEFRSQFDIAGAIQAIRPLTGEAGALRLGEKNFANGLPVLMPNLTAQPEGGTSAGMVEYDVYKGAGSVRLLLVPKADSPFAAAASLGKDEQKTERDRLRKLVNEAFKKAAQGPFEGLIRYADKTENLESLQGILEPKPVVFDSPATQVLEPGMVEIVLHFNDIGYGATLNQLVKNALVLDKPKANAADQQKFRTGLEQGKWPEGTLPPNLSVQKPKWTQSGEEVGFIVVGARGRIGKLLYQMFTSNPNYIPKAFLGVEDVDTFLGQYKADPTHFSMEASREGKVYELRKAEGILTGQYLHLVNKETGELLMDPKDPGLPLAIPYFNIRKGANEDDEAFERRMKEALGDDILQSTETIINAGGFALNKEDPYYQPFVNATSVKRIILTAPPKGEVDLTVIRGVNEGALVDLLETNEEGVPVFISCASCTTTGLGRAFLEFTAFLEERGLGPKYTRFGTDHALTNSQGALFGAASAGKSQRTAFDPKMSAVPVEKTGANEAVILVRPEQKGKLSGVSRRLGNYDGSLLEVSILVPKGKNPHPGKDEVNSYFRWLFGTPEFKGVVSYTEDLQTTAQIVGDKTAGIFMAQGTRVEEGAENILFTFYVGYDNEKGYAAAVEHIETLAAMAQRGLITKDSTGVISAPAQAKENRDYQAPRRVLADNVQGYAIYTAAQTGLQGADYEAYRAAIAALSVALAQYHRTSEAPQALAAIQIALTALERLGTQADGDPVRLIETDLQNGFEEMSRAVDGSKPGEKRSEVRAALSPAEIEKQTGLLEAKFADREERLKAARTPKDINRAENRLANAFVALWDFRHQVSPMGSPGHEKGDTALVSRLTAVIALKVFEKLVADAARLKLAQDFGAHLIKWPTFDYDAKKALKWELFLAGVLAGNPGLARQGLLEKKPITLTFPLRSLEREVGPLGGGANAGPTLNTVLNTIFRDAGYTDYKINIDDYVPNSETTRNVSLTFVPKRLEAGKRSEVRRAEALGALGPTRDFVLSAQMAQFEQQLGLLETGLGRRWEDVRPVVIHMAFRFVPLMALESQAQVMPFIQWDLRESAGFGTAEKTGKTDSKEAGLDVLIFKSIPSVETGSKKSRREAEQFYFALKRILEENPNLDIAVLAVGNDSKAVQKMGEAAGSMKLYFTAEYAHVADRLTLQSFWKPETQAVLQKIAAESHKQAQSREGVTVGTLPDFSSKHVAVSSRDGALLGEVLSGIRVLDDLPSDHPGVQDLLIRRKSRLVLGGMSAEEIKKYREIESRVLSAARDLGISKSDLSLIQRAFEQVFLERKFYQSA